MPKDERREREPAAAGASAESLRRGAHLLAAAESTAERVREVAATYGATGEAQVAGRVAEELHAGTFSMNAAKSGRLELSARTTAAAGQPTAAADIEILADGSPVDLGQVKYLRSASRARSSLNNESYEGYEGMQKIVPSDHVGQVGPDGSDRLRRDGVESTPLSRSGARDSEATTRALLRSARVRAVVAGGTIEAAVRGVRAGVENYRAVKGGKRDVGEAVANTGAEAVRGGVDGATRSAAVLATRGVAVRAFGNAAARSTVPIAVGLAGYEVVKDTIKVLDGELEPKELIDRGKGHLLRAAGACQGARLGSWLGSLILPGVGTIFGGVVGGVLGWAAGDELAA